MVVSVPKGQRLRVCYSCQKEELVRKDNLAIRCVSCGARERGRKGIERQRKNRLKATCPNCKVDFYTTKSAQEKAKIHYCSKPCYLASRRVNRRCLQCKSEFEIAIGRLSGKTNSSGNYCSRECYEKVLCQPNRITGRGSQWKKARTEALKRAPFCALCGVFSKLQVHHIVPFRINQNNQQTNLVPLCLRCHKHVENATQSVERAGVSSKDLHLAFWSMLKERQQATRHLLFKLQRHQTCPS